MLEIKPAEDIAKYANKLHEHEILIEDALVFIAQDGEEIGHLISYIDDGTLHIMEVECADDTYLYDGIIRAALNAARNRNIDKAVFHLDDVEKIEKLCFVADGEKDIKSIEKFLSKCKNCNVDK